MKNKQAQLEEARQNRLNEIEEAKQRHKQRSTNRKIIIAGFVVMWVSLFWIFFSNYDKYSPVLNGNVIDASKMQLYNYSNLSTILNEKGFVLYYGGDNFSQMQIAPFLVDDYNCTLNLTRMDCLKRVIVRVNSVDCVNSPDDICSALEGLPAWKLPDGEFMLGWLDQKQLSFLADTCNEEGCLLDNE